MGKVYVVDSPKGLLIWRIRDVLPEVRLFEDGQVAEEHGLLAVRLEYIPEFHLLKFESVSEAMKYIEPLIKEYVWYHVFTLSYGYNDKYPQNRNKRAKIQEIVPLDESEVRQ